MTQKEKDLRLNAPKIPRTHCYATFPPNYDIFCPICGKIHITWSEFEHHIWCYDCEKDVLISSYSEDGDIFTGPIPVGTAQLLGCTFDRINLTTNEIVRFKPDDKEYNSTWVSSDELHKHGVKLINFLKKQNDTRNKKSVV